MRYRRDRGNVSLALKAGGKKKVVKKWREEIIRRGRDSRAFRIAAEGEVQRIPAELRAAPKELASRFFQLASGHAVRVAAARFVLVVRISKANDGASL